MRLLISIKEGMSKRISTLALLLALVAAFPFAMSASGHDDGGELDVKEIIFEHLGDGYGWEVPFEHVYRIPLPVIVKSEDGKWFCFSSDDLTEIEVTENKETGKVTKHLVPVVKIIKKDGKEYRFTLAKEGDHKDKVVELIPDGNGYREYRPLDISITKNVAALFIAAILGHGACALLQAQRTQSSAKRYGFFRDACLVRIL